MQRMGSEEYAMNDYWLELKYYMSGLKLLAEMAYLRPGNRALILERWFYMTEKDPIRGTMREIVKNGIQEDWDIRYMIQRMIETVPKTEWYKADSSGRTFLSYNPEKTVERIYSEPERKYKLRAVYEGLYPGVDEFGQSFADLQCGYKAVANIKELEDYFKIGSLSVWEKMISEESDEDLSVLATGLSRGGRHQLLAGLPRERVLNIVMQTVLYGSGVYESADSIAKRMLVKWRDMSGKLTNCTHTQK